MTTLEKTLRTAVEAAQDVLAEYIDPGIELSDADCINRLLSILDHRDLVRALRSSPAVDGVGVAIKPLEWNESDGGFLSRGGLFEYWVKQPINANVWRWAKWPLGAYSTPYPTADEAKAAAEAHYQDRIRSALSTTSDRASVDPADLQLLMQLKRDNVWDGARPVVESDFEQCFRLSDAGLIALEQVAQGVRLNAWDRLPVADIAVFARRDDCLDVMVPSDLRMLVGRLARAESMFFWPDATRRQWWISQRVVMEGRINRADICDAFGVSVPQASADIQRWLKDNPGVLSYDKSAKCYRADRLALSKEGSQS